MSEKKSSGLSQEFLDDFFAEADEHLFKVRAALADLDDSEGKTPDPKIVGELFHNFHSFKGISAIVGLAPAEALAHAAEDLLRTMRGGGVFSEQALRVLNATSQKLEQIVTAFRASKPLPDIQELLVQIKQRLSADEAAVVTDEAAEPASDGGGKGTFGSKLWKFTFTPTQELTAQSINITVIREQLSQLGEIVKSTPVVKGKGITFEFLLALGSPPDTKKWATYGVAIESADTETAGADKLAVPKSGFGIEHNPFLAPSHVVRVDLKKLDDLMRLVGEMVIHRSRLDLQLARLGVDQKTFDLRDVHEANRMMGRSLRQMREEIMRMRLIPIAEIFGRLPFVVKDLERETSKKVALKIEGQDTAIDKYLVEKLKDPLLHLVRNAFSHGIESPAERKAASKPELATIELSALAAGDAVIIVVKDDGRGIDAEAIFKRAKKLGVKIPEKSENEAVLDILCAPGFSTRDDADRTSGRGVGMAVVQATINELGGRLTLETAAGKGTQFTLRLPSTVIIAETLLVAAGGQTCAVPQSSVREIFQATEADIKVVDGIEMLPYRGGVLPVTRLAGLFNAEADKTMTRYVLVITSERGSIGLLVEKLLGQREVVVRSFRDPLIRVDGVSGATELGDGKPVLILDGAALTVGKVRPPESLTSTR